MRRFIELATAAVLAVGGPVICHAQTGALPGLVYHPEGDAIVCTNATRAFNRPLYCHERFTLIRTGELPSLTSPFTECHAAFQRGSLRLPLEQFERRIARYRAGRMEWELSDSRLPGWRGRLTLTTLANANGFAARFIAETGVEPGDRLGWTFVPPDPRDQGARNLTREPGGFLLDRPGRALSRILARFSEPVAGWESFAGRNPADITRSAPITNDTLAAATLVAWLPADGKTPLSLAVAADENDPQSFGVLQARRKPLDPAAVADASSAFDAGLARVKAFGEQVVVDTPDAHFNAAVSASVAAAFGLFVDPCFVHGGGSWRIQIPGWRTMGAALNYGFHEHVKRSIAYWDSRQVKAPRGLPGGEYSSNGCQQVGRSRFFGAGFVHYGDPAHYEFQTQFFDEALRAWRATADPALERRLLPMLELHLERCRACFDPDGDGLYESYNNTWPNDSIWFSGGGTVDQTAYMYYGHRAAADLQRRAGNAAAATAHDADADRIRAALDRVLWLPRKGHYASYIDQIGLRRVHEDAWVYSEHLPIEAGMATPLQAWQAMYYTEWAMERFPFRFGGEMRQTSNYVPGHWSIREAYPGDNFAMALGYALAGQGDDAWQLLRGTFLHCMYGDPSPMRGYGNERGQYGRPNIVSPGGLSHPNCGIDFNDITSSFARAVVEGVFGWRPDYPNERVTLQPAFPSEWNRASIRTPDFSLAFTAGRGTDSYHVTLRQPAAMQLLVPVRARRVRSVSIDGQPAAFRLEPWSGASRLSVAIPATNAARIDIELDERLPSLKPVVLEQPLGAPLTLDAGFRIKSVIDPQEALTETAMNGSSLQATVSGAPGFRLFYLERGGDSPAYLPVRLRITDPAGEARRAEQSPRSAPADAQWRCLDVSRHFNGDVRTIHKQQYRSPRPDTASMRIGYDGWTAWTFTHWRIPVPDIQLDQVPALTDASGRIRTAANVPFLAPRPGTNIAFTSRWDNWPRSVTVPIQAKADAIWLLVCGSTNPMQLRLANAVIRFHYADGGTETLDLVPPMNFWSLCAFGRVDYDYSRDGFALPKEPPPQVQLGANCRAIVTGWRLRPDTTLRSVTLETLSQDVVIGLMGVSLMNPAP